MKKIGIASDHAGFPLKGFFVEHFKSNNIEFEDFGTYSTDSCDYADYGHRLAEAIIAGKCETGVAMCGSGIGISLSLNRHANIRAALCHNPEFAELARKHNDANALVLPGRYINKEDALEAFNKFMSTEFEGGRHIRRVEKIELEEIGDKD